MYSLRYFARAGLVVVMLIATGLLSGGCPRSKAMPFNHLVAVPNRTTAPPKLCILTILDRTTPDRLPGSRQRLATALPRRRNLTRAAIYRLDQSCVEIYSPDQPILDHDKLLERLLHETDSSHPSGTFPHVAWETLGEAAASGTLPMMVLWEGNGDQDDLSAEAAARTSTAIKALAQSPHIKLVVMVGVDAVNAARVRRELEPLKDRVRLLDEQTRSDQIVKLIDECLVLDDPSSSTGGTP